MVCATNNKNTGVRKGGKKMFSRLIMGLYYRRLVCVRRLNLFSPNGRSDSVAAHITIQMFS
jgi:hypothetical protein